MFRLDIWRHYDPCGSDPDEGYGDEHSHRRPDETYWFTEEALRATYIEHAEAAANDTAPDDEDTVRYLYWEKSFDEQGPAALLVNPDPPPAARLYTATWQAETGKTVVTEQLISLQRKEREPAASPPQLSPTEPGMPITAIRWGARVAGQCHKITVFGTDRARVENTLEEAVQTAITDKKATSAEDLSAMAAQSAEEQETYFQPIRDLEAKLLYAQNGPNIFASLTAAIAEIRGELFKVRAQLRPKYEAALASARTEAGLAPVLNPLDELPPIFLDEAERWAAASEAMIHMPPPPLMTSGPIAPQPMGSTPFGSLFGPQMAGMLGGGLGTGPIRLSMPPAASGPLSQAATAPMPTGGVFAAGMGIAGLASGTSMGWTSTTSPVAQEAYVTTPPIKYAAAVADKLEERAGALNQEARTWLVDAVKAERAQGRSWDSIAADLGVSRQRAHTRFAKAIGEGTGDVQPDSPLRRRESVSARFKTAVVEHDRAEAEELIRQTLSEVLGHLADATVFPAGFTAGDTAGKYREFIAAAHRYQDVVGPLVEMVVVGCRYAPAGFEEMFTHVLTALAEPSAPHQTVSSLIDGGEVGVVQMMSTVSERLQELAVLPAALVMYSGMIAALEAKNFVLVDAIAHTPVRISPQRADMVAAFQRLIPDLFIDDPDLIALRADQQPGRDLGDEFLRKLGAGEFRTLRTHFRGSNFMYAALKDRMALPLGRFDELFDQAEMMLGLLIADAQSYPQSWIGRYAVSVADSRSFEFSTPGRYFTAAVDEGEQWEPLRAGMFGGSTERLNVAVLRQIAEINKLAGYGGRALDT